MAEPEKNIDWGKVKAFAGLMTNDIGAAMQGALTYIGDRLGIFKALAAAPATSAELAELEIEISVLSEAKPIAPSEIEVGPLRIDTRSSRVRRRRYVAFIDSRTRARPSTRRDSTTSAASDVSAALAVLADRAALGADLAALRLRWAGISSGRCLRCL